MSKMNPNLPGLIISVKDISESSIPQARNPSLSSPCFPHPPHPQVLLVSASRNLTYLFLPLLPTFTAMVQAVSLTYLDPCNGLLHFPSLFLLVVARELFKIPIDCVTVRLQPLRWPSRPRVTCSCLLLWPHLSPPSLLSRHLDLYIHVQASSVLEALWHDILPSLNAPHLVSPPNPIACWNPLILHLGWWTHSWEHDPPRPGSGSLCIFLKFVAMIMVYKYIHVTMGQCLLTTSNCGICDILYILLTMLSIVIDTWWVFHKYLQNEIMICWGNITVQATSILVFI